jgi:hypothetical protein
MKSNHAAALHIVTTAMLEWHFVFRHKFMPRAHWACAIMVHNPIPQIPIFWSFSQHILPQMTQGVNAVMLVWSFF